MINYNQKDNSYMFVCGTARSGTSALCEMLNGHSAIVLGMERYKHLFSSGVLFEQGAKLFRKDRFFDCRETDTNISLSNGKYDQLYKKIKDKYDGALIVGDKNPAYYRNIPKLIETFPSSKIVAIVRDPVEVAMSWDRRSKDTSSWPLENDYTASVSEWTKAVQLLIEANNKFPQQILVVKYQDLFSIDNKTPLKLIKRCGLDPCPEFNATIKKLRKQYQKIKQKREPVRDDVVQFVHEIIGSSVIGSLEEIVLKG